MHKESIQKALGYGKENAKEMEMNFNKKKKIVWIGKQEAYICKSIQKRERKRI